MKHVTKRMNLNPTNSSLSRSLATRRTSPCFELLVQGSGFGQYECLELGPMAQAFSSLLPFDDHTPNNVLNKAMGIFCEPKTNQVVATSSSGDAIVSTDDKCQTAFSDSYFKRKNQLVRNTFENHTIAMPNNIGNSDVQGASRVNRRFTKRRSHKVAVGKKLFLLRKRDIVYTRSTRGFSLWKSKVLGVGGSSLKWSKSIEKHPLGFSESYCRLLELMLSKPRHDVASLATYLLYRLIFYGFASRYESAVLSMLGSTSTFGRVTNVTFENA
ncbi:hypothetical protein KIW84_061062 [Lathyrus oleraceus]|uniref:Uncharacterized protein n=1 Tax=Pisum sativum TaxID=3888 RepID=A0A9D4W1X0_PEA|nr:hypothetical protein KIW84_061062 [Pisum sativum]